MRQGHPERSSDDDFGYGWCYLEPALGLGSESSTAHCPLGEQREFRVRTPLPNYSVVVGCEGPPG